MLDQKDLESIRVIMKEEITKSEEKIMGEIVKSEEKMRGEIARSETSMKAVMRKEITRSENLILDETERTRSILENKIAKVQGDVDELKQYYHIVKLENENIRMLFQVVEDISKRVDKLEERTA
ncbi:MAG: hypothetical protein K2N87_00500 [Eubacterium sp.]|nr:hypothetical protein [Eubacterium sp.]